MAIKAVRRANSDGVGRSNPRMLASAATLKSAAALQKSRLLPPDPRLPLTRSLGGGLRQRVGLLKATRAAKGTGNAGGYKTRARARRPRP